MSYSIWSQTLLITYNKATFYQLTPSSPSSLKHSNLLCWVFYEPKAGLQKDCLWIPLKSRYDNISYIKYYLTKADAIRTEQ